MAPVSILIPVYNTEKYLAQTVESVLKQTFTDWELIIVDDCSSDNSFSIARSFAEQDSRISAIYNERNLGMMGNWNRGIELCHGKYFAKLDADDQWHPMMLEESLAVMENQPQVGMVCTAYVNIDSNGAIVEGSLSDTPVFARNQTFSCVDLVKQGPGCMLQYNILRQGTSLIRRNIFEQIGVYRTLLTKATEASVDTEMYFRIGCHYSLFCIDKPYYFYRTHPQSISATDTLNDLGARKLYEVKRVIVDYYYQQGKITAKECKKFQADTEFLYNSFLIYRNRAYGEYFLMLKSLWQNLIIDPRRALIENIHLDRLLKA